MSVMQVTSDSSRSKRQNRTLKGATAPLEGDRFVRVAVGFGLGDQVFEPLPESLVGLQTSAGQGHSSGSRLFLLKLLVNGLLETLDVSGREGLAVHENRGGPAHAGRGAFLKVPGDDVL